VADAEELNLQDCILNLSEWMLLGGGHTDHVPLEIWYTIKKLIEFEIAVKEGETIH
jgi:hypothetical protein|tara:strand:+ start:1371 stop:1538 length:168 start_codon:yes stop_codon:yes gene_type:complete